MANLNWSLAFHPAVRRRALTIAVVMGSILAIINHSDKLFSMSLGLADAVRIALSFACPYVVATFTSVLGPVGTADTTPSAKLAAMLDGGTKK
jgi:Mg/Co/Ni transporter MgtE